MSYLAVTVMYYIQVCSEKPRGLRVCCFFCSPLGWATVHFVSHLFLMGIDHLVESCAHRFFYFVYDQCLLLKVFKFGIDGSGSFHCLCAKTVNSVKSFHLRRCLAVFRDELS